MDTTAAAYCDAMATRNHLNRLFKEGQDHVRSLLKISDEEIVSRYMIGAKVEQVSESEDGDTSIRTIRFVDGSRAMIDSDNRWVTHNGNA